MSVASERQARLSERARAAGKKRIGLWIPGDVHAQVMREARARGITFQERIIQKLGATVTSNDQHRS